MNKKDEMFVKKIDDKVKSTIKKYKLLTKKDKILVAVSGGKDSTTILDMLKKNGYDVFAVAINVNLGIYSKTNMENITNFCREKDVPLYIISIKEEFGCSHCYIRDALGSKGIKLNSCAVCGVLRRYLINKIAKKLNATKLVTGHNLDDEAQSVMMNFFRNTLHWSARLGPKTGLSKIKGFVPRVKPMYFITEKEAEKYSKIMKYPVKYGMCPCSSEAFRNYTGRMLDEYEKENPKVKKNIIDYFMKISPELKKKYKNQEFKHCKKCGEPSRDEVCRTCQIIGAIKKV